jgi:transcriptional regulator with XRE-family HTH domain
MRYPRAQRAITGVLGDALRRAGVTHAALNRRLGATGHWMGRILSMERDISVAEFMAIAKEFGIRPSTLMARVERRMKG